MNTEENDVPKRLFQSERQENIAGMVREQGRIDVHHLANIFDVTTETIRRDLSDLQQQRIIRRVHGGAVPWKPDGFEPLLAIRNMSNDDEKRRIANLAVQELSSDSAIIIDSGSTTARFARAIPKDFSLTVLTNSIHIAHSLSEHDALDLIVIGGKLRKKTLAMLDEQAIEMVRELTVDTLFVSCDGMSAEGGLSSPYRNEAAFKKALISSSRRVVALVDQSKMDRDRLCRFASWEDIDVLITDSAAPAKGIAAIEAQGPTVLLA